MILFINSIIMMKYLIIKNRTKKAVCAQHNYSNYNELNFLLQYEKQLFENKKCPKIIYLSNFHETENEILKLKSNFEKIHNKYSDVESFFLNVFKKFSNLNELENILDNYGSSIYSLFPELSKEKNNTSEEISEDKKIMLIKEELKRKPYLLFNKYGDVKAYSQKEFDNIADSEMIYNYFDKFSILNNKTDILFMNDYDYIFLIFLDGTKIDYSHPNFKIFRKIFFNLNFFNLKFYVSTKVDKEIFNLKNDEIVENSIFLIKRKNQFNPDVRSYINKTVVDDKSKILLYKELDIDCEKFDMINISEDLMNSEFLNLKNNKNKKDFLRNLSNVQGNLNLYSNLKIRLTQFFTFDLIN